MSGGAGEHLLVPWAPGPLVDPHAPGDRDDRDDLDELVDELFPDVEGGPGVFDAALVAGGVGLLAWAVATGQGRGWIAAGVVLLALGLVLPARSVLRRVGARRAGWTEFLPLDTSDPAVRRLVDSHAEVLSIAARVGGDVADRAVAAAHRAVVETASLLGGRAPDVAAEQDYVQVRVAAIEALIAAVRDNPALQRGEHTERAAIAEARGELDAATGLGALRALGDLTAELRSPEAT
jgi:hypothetical protein